MPINTLTWGFSPLPNRNALQLFKAVERLVHECDLDLKCCILNAGEKPERDDEKTIFIDERDLYSLEGILKHRDKLIKYNDSVEFNPVVYDKVYEKLYWFVDCYARTDRDIQQSTGRHYQRRSVHSYLHSFNLLYHFFYGIFVKEQIQLVLLPGIPSPMGPGLIIYGIAKALNVKTVMHSATHYIPDRMFCIDNADDYGNFSSMPTPDEKRIEEVKLEKKFFLDHQYKQLLDKNSVNKLGIKERKKGISFWRAIRPIRQTISRPWQLFLKPHQIFEDIAYIYLRYRRHSKYRANLAELIGPVDYKAKYVYFPLHFQPESSTSVFGGIFCDQALALELLSKKIPRDWVIYVKENPIQTEFMRDETFFARLKLIGNLRMTPQDEDTFKLMAHSQFVATITGSAGWEAIRGGKPALVFGKPWYQNFEGVFKWHNNIDALEIAHYQIEHEKLESDYNKLVQAMPSGIVYLSHLDMVENFDVDKNTENIVKLVVKMLAKN